MNDDRLTDWQRTVLRAFDIEPWQAGLAPVPLRVRIRDKLTLARWRGKRALKREQRDALG